MAVLGMTCLSTASAALSAKSPAYAVMGERLQTLNHQILADRSRLSGVAEQYLSSGDLSEEDFNWLKITAEKYGLQPRRRGDENFFKALLSRIDAVPPSLALAQGWLEYGWLLPKSSAKATPRSGAARMLPPEDMHAWVHALNTEDRYAAFRRLREDLRRRHKPLTAKALAPALEPITSEGPRYTARINTVIHRLRLDRWDPKT